MGTKEMEMFLNEYGKNYKKQRKNRVIRVGIILCVISIAYVIVLFWRVKAYMDLVPVITPKTNVTVQTGSIVTADDLAVIEREVIRKRVYCVTETDLAQEKDDMLYIGDKEGELTVSVCATGVNHESREEQITIRIVSD